MCTWADPLGVKVGDLSDHKAVAEEQKVSTDTYAAMAARFDGAAGAFAYLLFILLYFPCTAAIAAVYQESGPRWTAFVAAWTTGMAYGVATLCYQLAGFREHPLQSLIWCAVIGVAFVVTLIGMHRYANREVSAGMLHSATKQTPQGA